MENLRSNGPGRILVIERDPAVSRFVEFVLGNWETFNVVSEAELDLALGRAKHELWDLILIDFELPSPEGPDGLDAMGLMAAIRAAQPELPVAMMTAFPVTGPTADQLQAADGQVTKPLVPSHLIGLATTLIERSRRMHEQAG
ncbi:MAG TPA: response regulator [Streptosporangiaceae bacterium]|nr:response regulator [Streptosporangiaceae bacterium]